MKMMTSQTPQISGTSNRMKNKEDPIKACINHITQIRAKEEILTVPRRGKCHMVGLGTQLSAGALGFVCCVRNGLKGC